MSVLRLLRPKQWSKNLLVFAAYLFAGHLGWQEDTGRILLAFAAMCLVSSATYVANDILDRDRDRQHPKKKDRPIASGAITVPAAIAIVVLLGAGGLGIGLYLGLWPLAILGGYVLTQILYNFKLKHVAVADVFTISTGFVLRAALGAQAIDVPISGWLLFCTASLALMLGFAKRRNEFIAQGDDRTNSREALADYSRQILDVFVSLFAGVSIMSYSIYSIQSETAQQYPGLLLTAPFVLYGVCRYLLIVLTKNEGGEPAEILLRDPHVIISVLGFVAAAIFAIQGGSVPIVN